SVVGRSRSTRALPFGWMKKSQLPRGSGVSLALFALRVAAGPKHLKKSENGPQGSRRLPWSISVSATVPPSVDAPHAVALPDVAAPALALLQGAKSLRPVGAAKAAQQLLPGGGVMGSRAGGVSTVRLSSRQHLVLSSPERGAGHKGHRTESPQSLLQHRR